MISRARFVRPAAILAFFGCFIYGLFILFGPMRFDSDRWKSSRAGMFTGVRNRMAPDAVARILRPGQVSGEVLELLGKPDTIKVAVDPREARQYFNDANSGDSLWGYWLKHGYLPGVGMSMLYVLVAHDDTLKASTIVEW